MKILFIALLLLLVLLSAAAVLLMLAGVISRVLREKSRRRARGSKPDLSGQIIPSKLVAEYCEDVQRGRDAITSQLFQNGLSSKRKARLAKTADELSACIGGDMTPQQKMELLIKFGNYYLAANNYQQARNSYESAKSLAARLEDGRGRLASLINLGLVSAAEMKWDEAVGHYQEIIAIERKFGYSKGEAIDLNTLGLLYEKKGDLDSALTHYSASIEIFRRLKDAEKTELVERNIKRLRSQAKKTST